MRFVVLPGYLQSGKVMAEKSSGLRKLMKKSNHELVYMDPPKVIETPAHLPFVLSEDANEEAAKWQNVVDANCNRCWWDPRTAAEYQGFESSYTSVSNYITENGPFDGIIGFSQGAGMALMLVEKFKFKCCLLFSGFCFTQPAEGAVLSDSVDAEEFKSKMVLKSEFQKYYDIEGDTKIFNVYGSNDVVVPNYKSRYIDTVVEGVEHFEFEGGHMMPNKKPFLNPLIERVNSIE